MNWRQCIKRQPQGRNDRFATASEMQAAFDLEHENLRWVSLVITGERLLAERSMVDASGLQRGSSGVFRDWLVRWAHSATARAATRSIHELISQSAPKYAKWVCDHPDHELLTSDQTTALRRLDPQQLVTNLDPLARSVLVLRGMQQASISDCALLLNVPRRSVIGAYCHALNWLRSHSRPENSSNFESTARSPEVCSAQK